jgi:hypothetical protein
MANANFEERIEKRGEKKKKKKKIIGNKSSYKTPHILVQVEEMSQCHTPLKKCIGHSTRWSV